MLETNHQDKKQAETSDEIRFVPESIRNDLSYRQLNELESHYQEYWTWLQQTGKIPQRKVGFAPGSVSDQFHRTTQFHRWVWARTETISRRITHAHADAYEKALAQDRIQTKNEKPYAEGSKRKLQQAVVNYFRFKSNRTGEEPWTPSLTFTQSEYDQADYFNLKERDRLYEAALTYDDVGKYDNLSPETRDRYKAYFAQKLGKPKAEVTPDDFERSRTSWKIPSLVSVALDLGARPAFISRCSKLWYKPETGVFQIPKDESPKNDACWEPGLSTRSVQATNKWLRQRDAMPKYDGIETLWLNREANPYRSDSLNYLLDQLLEEAGINQSNRKITWMSIRRSTGTYLTHFRSLAYAKEQLRHKSRQSTLRYVEIPVEARQNALDQLSEHSVAKLGDTQVNSIDDKSVSSSEVRYDD
ncbi:site-specific integrase [Natrarchaeobaculum sulfurireducens]|uniref:XerD/XerC family integrase n=1 Tax=Natrarchaeobaculum sulfurireducens TaxID=2044521 RepID=A0A346PD95_9EURY|nr:site-specific integrase [Natrarchaeobaculum sulfurireducens]AXR77490.1 XerD/XerC family integrase [Natrarchaeobaculum sulfurireducens]